MVNVRSWPYRVVRILDYWATGVHLKPADQVIRCIISAIDPQQPFKNSQLRTTKRRS